MARSRTKVFLLVVGVTTVLGALWATAVLVSGFGSDESATALDPYEERVLVEGESIEKVAMINIIGPIFSDPTAASTGASDTNIIQQLEKALEDDDVKAIILNLDTPGGGVVPSDKIYDEVREVDDQKPVIALMNNLAASGGYYISAGAGQIIAHPMTLTGSIGVISIFFNVEEAVNKLGVAVNVIKSDPLKGGSLFSQMTDQERAIWQGLTDEFYGRFVEVVAEGRDLSLDRVRELADGRIYSGKQAKELGLVDELGSRESAFDMAKELGKADDASLVVYEQPVGLFEGLIPFLGAESTLDKVGEELGFNREPGLAYLWIP